MRKLILLIGFFVVALSATAQQQQKDSLTSDTAHINEQVLIQQQQQKNLDELVKARLQNEMLLLAEDSKRKKELEVQLLELNRRDSIRKWEQQQRINLLKKTATPYPITLDSDTLFFIYTRLGSFNAAERAAAITNRLNGLYENEFFNADTLQLLKGDNGYDIVYRGDQIIMSITELDALFFNQTPATLGKQYLEKIKKDVIEHKKANSWLNWLKRLGLVTLVLAGIFLVIFFINRLFKIFSARLIAKKEQFCKGVSIKNFKLFTPKQHLKFYLRLLYVFKIVTILLALYLSLPLLFSIFPQTEAYTYTLLNWILTPARSIINAVVAYLPNLFTIIVIYFFINYIVKGVKYIANEVEKGNLHINGFYSDWAKPTFNIVKVLLYAFMLVVVYPYLPGSDSAAFKGVSVFLGILFSLGSSSAIGNMVAGLVITYMRPFKIGDRVKIGDITGDVLEKTLLVTRIRSIKNEEITIPNASILSGHTVNFSAGAAATGIIVHTTVTIGYDVAWKKMHEALINAALRTELLLKEPQPFVLQTSLEDYYVAYQINAYTKHAANQAKIYSDLHQHIQDCCNEAGIEILSPHYRAVRDGNMTTIPEDYLPKDYAAPKFKVSTEAE